MTRTIAIVGFAGSSRDLMNKEPESTEIWGLNNAYSQNFMQRPASRWFDIHGYEGRDEYRGKHWEKMLEMGIPIYALHPPIPTPENVVWLDYVGICERLGVKPYFTNSIAYMLAVAVDEHVDEIKLFGVDMATGTEFEKQRANCEYWIGIARGLGITVAIPDVSPICKGLLYGIDKDDGFTRRSLLEQLSDLRKQMESDSANFHKTKGAIEQVQGIAQAIQDHEKENGSVTLEDVHGILSGIISALREQEMKTMGQCSAVDGAIQATRNLMTKLYLPTASHEELALGDMTQQAPGPAEPSANGHKEEVLTNA